jgi:glutamate dehydrogenase
MLSGARPEAVNVSNVAALIDSDGKPHFKFIVEGANLFITQQARLHLEKKKVIVFKDSSANKGQSCPGGTCGLVCLCSLLQVA